MRCFSLLRFMQEGGRAGRDDADATVTLVGPTGAFLPLGRGARSGATRPAGARPDEITEWFYDGTAAWRASRALDAPADQMAYTAAAATCAAKKGRRRAHRRRRRRRRAAEGAARGEARGEVVGH